HDQDWDQYDDDPGAVHKLGTGDDRGRNGGGDRADAINENFLPPMRSARAQPATDHADLREGEREKHADGIERNQCVGVTVEYNDEEAREDSQDDNAIREHQTVA